VKPNNRHRELERDLRVRLMLSLSLDGRPSRSPRMEERLAGTMAFMPVLAGVSGRARSRPARFFPRHVRDPRSSFHGYAKPDLTVLLRAKHCSGGRGGFGHYPCMLHWPQRIRPPPGQVCALGSKGPALHHLGAEAQQRRHHI
jgi:hypothetical protein